MVRYTPSVAGDHMVEDVTRIETTGTGSATPSSSPTQKVSRWEQLDPSARTGTAPMPAPIEPPRLSTAADAAPSVRPLELPSAAKPPKMNFGGENFGFTKTNVAGFPYGIRNTPEWRVGGGKSLVSRGAAGVLNWSAGLGQPNIKSSFVSPSGKASAKSAAAFALIGILGAVSNSMKTGTAIDPATDTTPNEDLAAYYESMGYPKDIAIEMGNSQGLTTNLIGILPGLGAAAIVDTSVGAIGAGIGAGIGTFVMPGVGTAAGAAAGWAAGTTISGVSTLVNMFVEPFVGDVPTIDDLWGAKDIYQSAGELSFSAAESLIKTTAAGLNPDRLRGNDEVILMQNKVMSGAYATGKEPDPRGQEMADLVAQGYFIKTKPDGTQGIDILSYQQFQLDTMMYKQPQDMQSYLPTTKAAPRTLDQNEWIRLWTNAE